MKNNIVFIIITILGLSACSDDPVYPKPISGIKLSFPEKNYTQLVEGCAYEFRTPDYTKVDTSKGLCNLNIDLTPFNATLFLTYIPIDSSLMYHIEYSRKLVYDHSVKADAIEEKTIKNPENDVYGMAYKLVGNSASTYQFYVTDSVSNFLRGALYFNVRPNYDSLKPTIDYILPDFDTIFQTIQWQTEFNLKE